MAAICYHCGKGTMYGRTHTHHRGVAGGRWKKRAPKVNRVFKANLQPIAIIEAGEKIRVRLCTKCLKRVRKDMSEVKKPFVKLAYVQTTPTKLQESKNQKPTSPNV